jgi:hypothetical protein
MAKRLVTKVTTDAKTGVKTTRMVEEVYQEDLVKAAAIAVATEEESKKRSDEYLETSNFNKASAALMEVLLTERALDPASPREIHDWAANRNKKRGAL